MPRKVPNACQIESDQWLTVYLKLQSVRTKVLVTLSPLPTKISEINQGVTSPFCTGSLP